jgi:hypothetical protein
MSDELPFGDFKITQKVAKFLFLMNRHGKLTYDMQKMSNPIDYYQMMKYLKGFNIVFNDGLSPNHQKIWKLTKQGNEVAKLLKKVDFIIDSTREEFV